MGGLASSAMYLATSLASGPPPLVAADPVPLAVETPTVVSSPRAYVIVDLPAARSARLMSVADMGSRPEIEVAPAIRAGPPETSAGIDAEVIASHDQRIGVLRERIDTLRRDKAERSVVAALDARLKRAQAARQLAVARVALAQCGGTCAHAPAPAIMARRSSAPPMIAAKMMTERRPQIADASMTARTVPAPLLGRGAAASLTSSTLHSADRTPPLQVEPLARARLLLAKARAALTEEATPQVQLTGLWQWEGSERWSLSAGPQRTA